MCPAADMGSDWGEQDERSLAISFSLHSLSFGSCDDCLLSHHSSRMMIAMYVVGRVMDRDRCAQGPGVCMCVCVCECVQCSAGGREMRGWGMQGCRPRPKHVKPGGRQQKQSCSSRATARRKHLDVCRARSNDEFKRALPLLHSRVVLKLPRCAEIPICPGGLTNVPLNEKCDDWDGYNKRIRWIRNGEFPHEACLSLRVLLVHYIPN
jgi:hypothetical protein